MSQFTEAFLGEVRLFAGNYPPNGWAYCQGQLMQISDYQALYSILGTIYGGDGRSTFALPNLTCRVPVQQGHQPPFNSVAIGYQYGFDQLSFTIHSQNLPPHSHYTRCSSGDGNMDTPVNAFAANEGHPGFKLYSNTGDAQMGATTETGNGEAITLDNRPPMLGMNYIIAVEGVYPPRQ